MRLQEGNSFRPRAPGVARCGTFSHISSCDLHRSWNPPPGAARRAELPPRRARPADCENRRASCFGPYLWRNSALIRQRRGVGIRPIRLQSVIISTVHSGHAAVVQNDLNLTAAANKPATTQPAVSKQFKSLESELGFRIFTRRGRAFTKVKPAGERIVMYANSACIRALPSRSPKWASWGALISRPPSVRKTCFRNMCCCRVIDGGAGQH